MNYFNIAIILIQCVTIFIQLTFKDYGVRACLMLSTAAIWLLYLYLGYGNVIDVICSIAWLILAVMYFFMDYFPNENNPAK